MDRSTTIESAPDTTSSLSTLNSRRPGRFAYFMGGLAAISLTASPALLKAMDSKSAAKVHGRTKVEHDLTPQFTAGTLPIEVAAAGAVIETKRIIDYVVEVDRQEKARIIGEYVSAVIAEETTRAEEEQRQGQTTYQQVAEQTYSPTPVISEGSLWDQLAGCESGGDWHINTGNGYYGGLQEGLPFWISYGGLEYSERPDLASREQQIIVAERGRDAAGGYSPWPQCAASLGLH